MLPYIMIDSNGDVHYKFRILSPRLNAVIIRIIKILESGHEKLPCCDFNVQIDERIPSAEVYMVSGLCIEAREKNTITPPKKFTFLKNDNDIWLDLAKLIGQYLGYDIAFAKFAATQIFQELYNQIESSIQEINNTDPTILQTIN